MKLGTLRTEERQDMSLRKVQPAHTLVGLLLDADNLATAGEEAIVRSGKRRRLTELQREKQRGLYTVNLKLHSKWQMEIK